MAKIKQKSKFDFYKFIKSFKQYNDKLNSLYKLNFQIPFDNNFNSALKKLDDDDGIKLETKNLFYQSYSSLSCAEKLLDKRNLVEATILLRAAYENIATGYLIHNDINMFEEFKIVNLKPEKRNLTKLTYIQKNFKKELKLISPELFGDISNTKLSEYIDDLYDKLCLYTHSSLAVSLLVEMKKNNDDKLIIPFIHLNLISIKIILLCCINYQTKTELEFIDYRYYIVYFFMRFINAYRKKHTSHYLKKYNELLYPLLNNLTIYSDKDGLGVNNFFNDFTELFTDDKMMDFYTSLFEE